MENVTILTLLSGREKCLEPYLLGLQELDYPKDRLTLVWYCNSESPLFRSTLQILQQQLKTKYKDVILNFEDEIKESTMAFSGLDKRYTSLHGTIIATLYNRAYETLPDNEYIFFVEDDIVLPSHALKRLLSTMEKNPEASMVAGVTFDRHSPEIFHYNLVYFQKDKDKYKLIKWHDRNLEKKFIAKAVPVQRPWGVKQVNMFGLAITLARRSKLELIEKPLFQLLHKPKNYKNIMGCDMVLGIKFFEMGIPTITDFDVRSLHIDHLGKIH